MPDLAQKSEADREIAFQAGVSSRSIRGIVDYVKKHYLDSNVESLENRSYREKWAPDNGRAELEWTFSPSSAHTGFSVQPLQGKSVRLTISTTSASISFGGLEKGDARGLQACTHVADDVEVMITLFLSKSKTTQLYFIFSSEAKGRARDSPTAPSVGRDALKRLLSGNMTNVYLLIMALSFVLFFVLGALAIFAVLAIQLLALFYSDRLSLMVGKVKPNSDSPWVTMVGVPVPNEAKDHFAKLPRGKVEEIADQLGTSISQETLEGPGASKAVQEMLAASGVPTSTDEVKVVTRNVFGLVKGVADRFRLPTPKITIVNSVADNAAATGISPSRASITITAGSLEDLGDPELSAVIGHELGHIKGRDSLILFSATFILYVGGLYLWFPLLLALGIFYYILIFAIIFAVGKVLETRADTESAVTLGTPAVLASALSTIGFRQLYVERYSHRARVFDWLSFDPHPPIYFRVQRLSRIAASGKSVGNTLLIAIKDCATGFLETLT